MCLVGCLQAEFSFDHADYEKQLMRLLTKKERSGLIISNPDQTMFLFIDKHQLQVSSCQLLYFLHLCLFIHLSTVGRIVVYPSSAWFSLNKHDLVIILPTLFIFTCRHRRGIIFAVGCDFNQNERRVMYVSVMLVVVTVWPYAIVLSVFGMVRSKVVL